jgi:hypothetical protein
LYLNLISISPIIFRMSEEITQNIPDGRSFEERIFARFDAIDARLSEIDVRLNQMDTRLSVLEQKAYDTKPIWERALAEILAVSQNWRQSSVSSTS